MLARTRNATLFARHGILGCWPDHGYRVGLFQIVVGVRGGFAFGWSMTGILRPRELPQRAFQRLMVCLQVSGAARPAATSSRAPVPPARSSGDGRILNGGHGLGAMLPGVTWNICARHSISANAAGSAPVIQTCAPSFSSSR